MNLFEMTGPFSWGVARVYSVVVVPALTGIYHDLLHEYVPRERMKRGMRILDVGCGAGQVLRLLGRSHPEVEFTGADLSPHMVERARRASTGLANVSVKVGDAMNLPFDPGEFDIAISLASIKHWPDMGRGVAEIFRILKPGGMALIMEVDRHASREASRNFLRLWRFTPWFVRPPLLLYFERFVVGQGLTGEELRSLCVKAGFTKTDMERRTDFPGVIARGFKPS